ncbi:MAG: hypothetical protein ACOCYO_06900 [Bacteroidota bacterium]
MSNNNNTGITLVDVRQQALDAIKELKSGEMDIKTAKEIREFLKVIIDMGKTQVDFLNAIPSKIKERMDENQIKAIAGTLKDRDAELDETLYEIEQKNKTYKIG